MPKRKTLAEQISDLAQKLYNEDGYPGNIYKKAELHLLTFYEYKAEKLLKRRRE